MREIPLPYLLTLLPPLVLSLLDPEIFFKALDFAGTYGGKDPFKLSLIMNRCREETCIVLCYFKIYFTRRLVKLSCNETNQS